MAAWAGGSGRWSVPQAVARGEFLSFMACVALRFSCLSVKKLILTGLREQLSLPQHYFMPQLRKSRKKKNNRKKDYLTLQL